ncbi:MAG: hypothetical protein ACLVB5_04755 [Christensenellales bacterium]
MGELRGAENRNIVSLDEIADAHRQAFLPGCGGSTLLRASRIDVYQILKLSQQHQSSTLAEGASTITWQLAKPRRT